jgi:kumamolisin
MSTASTPYVPSRTEPWHLPSLARAAVAVVVVGVMVLGGLVTLGGPTTRATTPRSFVPSATPQAPPLLSGSQLQGAPYLTGAQSNASVPSNASVLGPTPSAQSTLFTIGFQMRNSAELDQILSEQATPGSPMFHQWLTLDQEKAMFGPDPTVVQDTINYFTSLGFHVATQGVLSVSFTGTAGLANVAFRTSMVQVRAADGSVSTLNQQPLSLPSPIAPFVASINGLDTRSQAHVEHFLNPTLAPVATGSTAAGVAPSVGATPAGVRPFAPPGATMVNISSLYNFSNHAFGWVYYFSHSRQAAFSTQIVTPGALSYLYQALPLVNAGYNGNSTHTPITIAIVMAGGINPDDLKQYGAEVWNNPNNILSRLSALPVDGSYGLNGTLFYTDGDSNEMALDIEYSSTMAPAAHILAVYGPGLYTTVLDDDYAALENLVTAPNIVSNSWGGSEDRNFPNLYGASWNNGITMHNYIGMLTARGTTVLASSGDGGGFDPSTGMLSGFYPATDPYVTSVDGIRTAVAGPTGNPYPPNPDIGWTNVSLAPGTVNENYETRVSTATQIIYQSYWYVPFSNYTLLRAPPEASGGFGTSEAFNQSWYQHGPFMPNLGRSLGSAVAAEADFNESIFFDGTWEFDYGGTSFACPTTAGIFALVEDYLAAHGQGRYLGNGNIVTALVGNAWFNGNLTLVPYYDVTNGTSYWGNQGVANGWSWPPGQEFPMGRYGSVYGNSTVGWDFPTGWGTINVANFAKDLSFIFGLPGQFGTLTSNGLNWNPAAWANLALNNTYTFHVNASAALQLTNPHVTVVFRDSSGVRAAFQPALTTTALGPGYDFTLDTSQAPFDSPGYIVFEFGNSTTPTLGWFYSWISQDISPSGTLTVQVVAPSTGSYPGGFTIYNAFLGWVPNVYTYPDGVAQPFPNTFTVLVEDNGIPVYNAVVTATINSTYDIFWENSVAANRTSVGGNPGHALATTIVSTSFSNRSGDALVQTINTNKPVQFHLTATYGPLSATTNYRVDPLPNVKPVDNYGGVYSSFNFVSYLIDYYHLTPTIYGASCQLQNAFVANSCNQSGYVSMLYGWQGEELPVSVNDYTGAPMANMNVWLGDWDFGHPTRFVNYQPSYGVFGITNTSGTSNVTDASGRTTVYIPDNQTAQIGFLLNNGQFAGIDYVDVALPGLANRSFGYREPCAPSTFPPTPLISCQFNNSFQRNYTSEPVVVFPNPITTYTQTREGAVRDFFNTGTNISWTVKVRLPSNDPFVLGTGTNWNPGLEHVVSVRAYVDGVPAGSLSPTEPNIQYWFTYGNLTGDYAPGIHTLRVVVTDSLGHVFTQRHIFIVGSIQYTDFGPSNLYSVMPFNLTWSLNLPFQQVSNKTFNMSLEIRYVTSGCGGIFRCPQVVNYSIPVHVGQLGFNQSINRTLMTKNGFYTGAGDLPPGQYQFIVWLNANHSGSVSQSAFTFLVFDPLAAQIDGPSANAVVPIGNLTISYSYGGQYVENAVLSVYSATGTIPVYQVGALVPGIGSRGGSATWTSVLGGSYHIVLQVTVPYDPVNLTSTTFNYTVGQWINVTSTTARVYVNGSSGQVPIAGLPAVLTATVLALVAAVIGLILGLLVAAPVRANGRNGPGAAAAVKGPTKPWEEPTTPVTTGGAAPATPGNVCSICHERFETPYALAQHAKISHGVEE